MLKSNTPPADQYLVTDVPPLPWGAAAVATVGSLTVEADEALTTDDWQLGLDTPVIYLRVKIDGPEIITALHAFLIAPRGAAGTTFTLGQHGSQNVELLRDDEPGNRCFILVGASETSSLRLTLDGEECQQWAQALEDVRDQLRG